MCYKGTVEGDVDCDWFYLAINGVESAAEFRVGLDGVLKLVKVAPGVELDMQMAEAAFDAALRDAVCP